MIPISAPHRAGQRRLSVVAGVAALIVALAGCGGGSSSNGPGNTMTSGASTSAPSTVAYSGCMRSHGVPSFPDPDSNGNLPKADAHHLGVSSSQLQAAEQACQRLLPNDGGAITAGSVQQCMEGGDCPPALVQQVLTEERHFAQCMRAHGVPNWPDPSIDSQGRPVFAISISRLGFDPYSRHVWAQGNECSYLMPQLPGLPAAVSP